MRGGTRDDAEADMDGSAHAALPAGLGCVVFDLDGTLIDSRPAMLSALALQLHVEGRASLPEAALGEALHHGLAAMLERAYALSGGVPADLAARTLSLRQRYLDQACSGAPCFAGAVTLLEQLRERGCWLGLCSNQDTVCVQTLLQARGLTAYFDSVLGGDSLTQRKPDPAPLRWLVERAGASPERSLMVGDSELDAECAERSGSPCVIMAHGYGGAIRAPHRRVEDFATLSRLLLP